MNRIRPLGVALILAVGMTGVACDDHAAGAADTGAAPATSASSASSASAAKPMPSASASAKEAADEPAPDGKKIDEENDNLVNALEVHQRHHHGGFTGFVLMAAETLGVTPEQQAGVDKAKAELNAKMKPVHEADSAVLNLLADGIAAGKIDKAKVDAAVVKANAASAAAHPAGAEFLDSLHKTLKPEQRQALVDKVDALWEVWREANVERAEKKEKEKGESKAKEAKEEKKDEAKEAKEAVDDHIDDFAKQAELTPDQVSKLKAELESPKEPKKTFDSKASEAHLKEFSAAFVTDTFEAKKLAAFSTQNAPLVSWGSEHMVRFYEAVAPILTPEQRPKVAAKLREHANDNVTKEKP